jgi:hypothetical protein
VLDLGSSELEADGWCWADMRLVSKPPRTQYGATRGKPGRESRLDMKDLQTGANFRNASIITRNKILGQRLETALRLSSYVSLS